MLEFLFLPASFLGGLACYSSLEKRAARKAAVKSAPHANAKASVQIMDITSTNNRYAPITDVLSDLDLPRVQQILGEPLRTDTEGYMQ